MARIVLVTGCSTGVGLDTAVMLAKQPQQCFKVYATMRNLQKKTTLEKAAGIALNKTMFIEELDISKEESIERFGKHLLEKEGRIDILVNNAAIGQCGIFEKVSMKQAHELFQTNFFGTMRLTQEFVPQMKKQKSGVIIFVTSDAGFVPIPFLDYYVASKHAVEGLAGCLAAQMRFFNVHVSTVQPGPIDTPLLTSTSSNNQGGFTEGNERDVDELTVKLRNDLVGHLTGRKMQTSKEVAEVILKAVTDSSPKRRYQTSESIRESAKAVFVDPDGNVSIDGAEKLLRDGLR